MNEVVFPIESDYSNQTDYENAYEIANDAQNACYKEYSRVINLNEKLISKDEGTIIIEINNELLPSV